MLKTMTEKDVVADWKAQASMYTEKQKRTGQDFLNGNWELATGKNPTRVLYLRSKTTPANIVKIYRDGSYFRIDATTQISKKNKVIRVRQAVKYDQKYCFDAETTQYWCFEKLDKNAEYAVRTIKYGVKDGLERIVDMWESGVWFAQNLIDTEYNLLIKLEG